MAAPEAVEGWIALASVVTVEEAVLLLSVEGIVGGVEVENKLSGACRLVFSVLFSVPVEKTGSRARV